jgi:predicted MFS family arabinose efflux permease
VTDIDRQFPLNHEEASAIATPTKWKTVVLASLGSGLEFYDFIIYGAFALQIGTMFFPKTNALVSMLGSFSVFAVGYIARPLGGSILGSLGDRVGRKKLFVVSILVMSVCTMVIGLLPTYEQIGILAPVLLVLTRLIQGFFVAGELACSITYVVEEMPRRASFVGAIVVCCMSIGSLLATAGSYVLHATLSPDQFNSFGWRIAFLFGGVIGLCSYVLRRSLEESGEFHKLRKHVVAHPFREVMREHLMPTAVGVLMSGVVNAAIGVILIVLPPYLVSSLGYDAKVVSSAQPIGMGCISVGVVIIGLLGEKIPPRWLHRTGCVLMLILAYPIHQALVAHSIPPLLAFVSLGAMCAFLSGTYAFLLADLFPTNVRFSGVALSLNVSAVLFQAVTPLAITGLMAVSGDRAAPGMFLAVTALIALVSGFWLHKYGNHVKRVSDALRD